MKKSLKRPAALVLSMLILLGMMALSAMAIPTATPLADLPKPGEDGYVSLHKYATPTGIEDVYKVTLNVTTPQVKKPAMFITFVLDTSGSMGTQDIWDIRGGVNNTGALISRRDAVVQCLNAAMNELKNVGDKIDIKNTYVNIISESNPSSPYLARSFTEQAATAGTGIGHFQGFVPLMAADGTTYNTDIDTAITNFQGLSGNSDMEMGFGEAYRSLALVLRKASGDTTTGYSWQANTGTNEDRMKNPIDVQNAVRIVLVLGDGDAYGNLGSATSSIFAIKAPPSYANGQLQPSATFGKEYGLGATVWSLVIGSHGGRRNNWKQDVLDTVSGGAPDYDKWYNTYWHSHTVAGAALNAKLAGYKVYADPYTTGNFQWVEPFMITVAFNTNVVQTAAFSGDLIGTGASSYADAIKFMQEYATGSALTDGLDVNYHWVQHINGTLPDTNTGDFTAHSVTIDNRDRIAYGSEDGVKIFEGFIKAAAADVPGGVLVKDKIGSQFSFYQMAGEPTLKTENLTLGGVCDPGTASIAGDVITWNLGSLDQAGETLQLTFYVKMKDNADPTLWYPTNEYAYISYALNDMTYIIYFPVPLVNKAEQTTMEKAEVPKATPEPTNVLYSVPMFVYRMQDESRQPYTPSVTPKPAQ